MLELGQDIRRPGKSAATFSASAPDAGDGPFQRRRNRSSSRVEIGAIKTKPGFQPKTVSGAEPDRHDGCVLQERAPERGSRIIGDADLEAVLARIAGAGDDAVGAA